MTSPTTTWVIAAMSHLMTTSMNWLVTGKVIRTATRPFRACISNSIIDGVTQVLDEMISYILTAVVSDRAMWHLNWLMIGYFTALVITVVTDSIAFTVIAAPCAGVQASAGARTSVAGVWCGSDLGHGAPGGSVNPLPVLLIVVD